MHSQPPSPRSPHLHPHLKTMLNNTTNTSQPPPANLNPNPSSNSTCTPCSKYSSDSNNTNPNQTPNPPSSKEETAESEKENETKTQPESESESESEKEKYRIQKSLHRITSHPTLTAHQRRTYRALLSVPRGRWTTYSALATHLGSSARAVGNAMRSNPFAPDVPCHRVLAADASLGGYKGETSSAVTKNRHHRHDGTTHQGVRLPGHKTSKHLAEKRRILEREGVVFGRDGRALGVVFRDFSSM